MRDMGSPVSSKDCDCLFTRLWSDCKIFKHEKYSRVYDILLLGKFFKNIAYWTKGFFLLNLYLSHNKINEIMMISYKTKKINIKFNF
jgi:hypothetical protein